MLHFHNDFNAEEFAMESLHFKEYFESASKNVTENLAITDRKMQLISVEVLSSSRNFPADH